MDSDESINEARLLELIPNTEQISEVEVETEATKHVHPVLAQQLKQPRCKSSIWIYFERLDTTLAKCRICQNNYRFGSSISNLRHHAEVKHGDILQQGPVKFLELLKVPKEHLKELIHPKRKPAQDRRNLSGWPHSNKKRKLRTAFNQDSQRIKNVNAEVKEENGNADTSSISFNEADVNKALESIYQNSDDTINNYMESLQSNGNDSPTNDQYERLDSTNNDYTLNGPGSEFDEDEIDYSAEPVHFNPLNTSAFRLHNDHKFQRLREERMRAETNYFNKKAAYMERSAEYVEAQKQHVILQSKKLKMELSTMKQSFQSS